MPKLTTLAPDAPHADLMTALERDGAVILKDALSPTQLERIRGELDPFLEATEDGKDDFFGKRTTRTGALMARSAMCREMAVDPRIKQACDDLLLANCERYQIHVTQAIRIRPGETAQDIHKDKWAWGTHFTDVEPMLSTMWALTDFTQENGATAVVPGSGRWPNDRRPTDDEIAYAEMTRGSVMLFTGSVLHGGGANASDGDRIGVLVDYALGWIRQEENQYLSCPPEIAKHFDPELQALLGYTMATYTLGYFTPPVAPGEGPEAVTPAYALDADVETGKFGGEELQEALLRDIQGG